jgi:hypothetical protein
LNRNNNSVKNSIRNAGEYQNNTMEGECAYLYVVSDASGFVVAYKSVPEVQAFMEKYSSLSFLVQRFELSPGQTELIWVVLYRDIDAVLYVSNNMEDAERIREMYGKVGLTYADPVTWWEQKVGEINQLTQDRLTTVNQAHVDYSMGIDNSAPTAPVSESERHIYLSPLVRFCRENETVSLMKYVVPADEAPAADVPEPATSSAADNIAVEDDAVEDTNADAIEDTNADAIEDTNADAIEEIDVDAATQRVPSTEIFDDGSFSLPMRE